MIGRLRGEGLYADVRRVFESPTLAALAASLGSEFAPSAAIPPNLIPAECEAIDPSMLPLIELGPEQIERIVRTVPGGVRNIQDIYPLAPLQEGILFHHLLGQKGDTYIATTLFQFSSRPELDAFISALQGVVDRHDVLRTAVLWEDLPQPVQVVWRRARLPIDEIELDRDRDSVEQLEERMTTQNERLELRQAPLMRLEVAADVQGAQWYALLHSHHLAGDRVSLEIITSEVMAHHRGRANELPRPVPYRNHVAQTLAQRSSEEAKTFFRKRLGHIDEPTAPFGILDVHGDGRQVAEATRQIDGRLAERVRSQAKRLKVSVATLLHAAWGLVVSVTSGRAEVVFGTVLSGRMQDTSESQHAIGMLINTLPLRLRLQDLTVGELVQQTQRELMELVKYEQFSLTSAQRCSSVSGSAPLFTALLNYTQSAPNSEAGWVSVASEMRVLGSRWRTNYPFALSVEDDGEGFALIAQTDRRIDPYRLLDYLRTALQSLVESVDESLQIPALALAVLPENERRQVTEIFNATRVALPRNRLVHGMFEDQVKRTPAAIALLYEQQNAHRMRISNARAKPGCAASERTGNRPGSDSRCVFRSWD